MGPPHPNGHPASVSPPEGRSPLPRPPTIHLPAPPAAPPGRGLPDLRPQPSTSLPHSALPQAPPVRSHSRSRPQGALWWERWGMSGTPEEPRTGLDPQGQGQGAGAVWGRRPARANPRDRGGDTLGGAVEGTETCDLSGVNVALVPTVQMEPGREVSPGPSLKEPASPASPLPPGWGHPAIPGSPPCPGGSRPPQPPACPAAITQP